jgi:hypothetical protein
MVWSDETATCSCPDSANQIYANKQCITCDASIYASGKKEKSETACNCLIKAMKWVGTSCVCNDTKAIPIVSATGPVCELCTSSRIKGVSKSTSSINECKCPNNLIWDPSTLSCICSSNQLSIQGSGATAKCVCPGTSIQPYN